MRAFLPLLVLFWLAAGAALAIPPWHHGSSPYRATFEIVTRPTEAAAGVVAQVPVCGVGFADGSDVRAFDEAGNPLPLTALGESVNNTALVLFLAAPELKRVFLYWGSKSKASENRTAFKPGLTLDIRTAPEGSFKTGKDAEKLLEKSRRVACLPVDRILLSYNPVDNAGRFLMVYDGFLHVPQAGEQTLMLVCERAGVLLIDGKEVLTHESQGGPGEMARGECRAAVNLSAGLHAVRAILLAGDKPMAIVGRWIGDRNKHSLEPGDFLQSGSSKLTGIEALDTRLPCPSFRYNQLSYIGYQGVQYTEVEFASLNGAVADWQFADGAHYQSASFHKVFVGLGTADVTVRQGRVEGGGKVMFPQQPPPAKALSIPEDFNAYSALITQENPEKLDLPTLKGYRAFLGFKELNAAMIPVCATILKREDIDAITRWEALRDIARGAAARKPEDATAAYETLVMEKRAAPFWTDAAQDYAEFALFNRRDLKLADRILREIERRDGGRDTDAPTFRFLLALQKPDLPDAKARLERLSQQAAAREKQASSAIKRNALEQRYADLLAAGFLLDARKCLRQWQMLSPEDWSSGRLPLAWARLWRAYDWPQGAMAELEGALALNPLLPNLPEIEFAQGELFEAMGEKAKALEAFKHIVEKYPNHPVAARARLRIR